MRCTVRIAASQPDASVSFGYAESASHFRADDLAEANLALPNAGMQAQRISDAVLLRGAGLVQGVAIPTAMPAMQHIFHCCGQRHMIGARVWLIERVRRSGIEFESDNVCKANGFSKRGYLLAPYLACAPSVDDEAARSGRRRPAAVDVPARCISTRGWEFSCGLRDYASQHGPITPAAETAMNGRSRR